MPTTDRLPREIQLAIAALDAIKADDDPEKAHAQADDVLLHAVPWQLAAAYTRVTERARWWASA